MIAATVGVTISSPRLIGNISLGDPVDTGSTGNIIQYVLVGLLVLLAIKNYVRRETIEPPKWLGTLQDGGRQDGVPDRAPADLVDALGPHNHDDGGHEPRAEQRLFTRRGTFPRGDRSDGGASGAVLPAVSQARRSDACQRFATG